MKIYKTVYGFPEWDGLDHITKLASYVQTDNDVQWCTALRDTLSASLRGFLEVDNEPYKKLVLIGKAGIGKTTFINHLLKDMPSWFNGDFDSFNAPGYVDYEIEIPVKNINWNEGKPGGYFDVDIKQVWAQALVIAHQE